MWNLWQQCNEIKNVQVHKRRGFTLSHKSIEIIIVEEKDVVSPGPYPERYKYQTLQQYGESHYNLVIVDLNSSWSSIS